MVTLQRLPFARADIVRELVARLQRTSCHWCGNRPGKFRYGVHKDDKSRAELSRKAYCSKGCWQDDMGGIDTSQWA
ncbi:MAG: hypothetical protein JSS66_05645 [Armatimonadetes bacterium]|nr:hypothetical protein [Armatimonadota bacterium]